MVGFIPKRARFAACLALLAALAACGGGGSGESDTTRSPLPQLLDDVLPAGARIDVDSDNFFAVAAGDEAVYRTQASNQQYVDLRRVVVQGPDASKVFVVEESVPVQPALGVTIERWQQRAEGLYSLNYFGDDAPPGVKALTGETLLYPTPFYPVGSVRTLIRQGGLGADLDEDSVQDSFRFELRQTFVGFESGTRGGRVERRARFLNEGAITIHPSRRDLPSVRSEYTEEVVFAAHTGMISASRTLLVDGSNVAPHGGPVTLVSGSLAGRSIETAWNAGTVRYLRMQHYDLEYEPVNGYYYAGLGAEDLNNPGTVARIDPVTGNTAFSEPLGYEVRSIAVSIDGRSLFAGVFERAEIIQLSLPDLQVVRRIPIQAGTWAFGLTASPVDSTVFAYNGTVFAYNDNNFDGLRLVRNGVVQPRSVGFFDARVDSPFHPTLFTPDGSALLLFGSVGVSGSGLLRVGVRADGLDSPAQPMGVSIEGRSLSSSSAGIVAGTSLFRNDDLALLVMAPAELQLNSCVALRGTPRWACHTYLSGAVRIGVLNAPAMTLIDDGYIPLAPPPSGYWGSPIRLVAGPKGQLAVMLSTESNRIPNWLVLFDNPDFR